MNVCKVENSHRDKTEQCGCYIYSRECLSCTKFFVGLGGSGEIETEEWCAQFLRFFQYEVSSTVLYAMMAVDRGSRPARK